MSLLFAIIILKEIFSGKWYSILKRAFDERISSSFYETEPLKPGLNAYTGLVYSRSIPHLILIISLVVLLAYLFKIRYTYFTGGHICQPYRVEIVERNRFAAEDRSNRTRIIFWDRQKNDISRKDQRNLNHFRFSALLCHGLCLLPNTVTTTADDYYYYYYLALKKLSYIYAKKVKNVRTFLLTKNSSKL